MKNKFLFEIIGFESPEFSDVLRRALTRHGVKVASISVAPLSAPMTGDHLMQATLVAVWPPEISMRSAEHVIEEISPDLNVIARAA